MTPHGYGRPSLDDLPDPSGGLLTGGTPPTPTPVLPGLLPAAPPALDERDPTEDGPNVARMYDYMTGGDLNFRADRAAVERLLGRQPDAARAARENRACLSRAVRTLLQAGVRQFVDLGAGIPTRSSVHELARATPGVRVLYVDIDPVAVAHGARLLAGHPSARMIRADLRRPDHILAHRDLRELIDFSRPVALVLGAVLHFVADRDDPTGLVGSYRDALPEGSFMLISHGTTADPLADRAMAEVYAETGMPLHLRPVHQVQRLFAGTELLPPGLVPADRWRPEATEPAVDRRGPVPVLVAVSRIPAGRSPATRRAVWAGRTRNGFPAARPQPSPPPNSAGTARPRDGGPGGARGTPSSRWSVVPPRFMPTVTALRGPGTAH